MKYYCEYFGFSVNKTYFTIECVCSKLFNLEKTKIVFHPLFNCSHCNELWHIEKEGKDIYRLIRPRTNSQIVDEG